MMTKTPLAREIFFTRFSAKNDRMKMENRKNATVAEETIKLLKYSWKKTSAEKDNAYAIAETSNRMRKKITLSVNFIFSREKDDALFTFKKIICVTGLASLCSQRLN